MIRVTVDLLRVGEERAETISILEIANRSTFGQVCNYDFRFDGGDWRLVTRHDRRAGVWALVHQVLAAREWAPRSDRT